MLLIGHPLLVVLAISSHENINSWNQIQSNYNMCDVYFLFRLNSKLQNNSIVWNRISKCKSTCHGGLVELELLVIHLQMGEYFDYTILFLLEWRIWITDKTLRDLVSTQILITFSYSFFLHLLLPQVFFSLHHYSLITYMFLYLLVLIISLLPFPKKKLVHTLYILHPPEWYNDNLYLYQRRVSNSIIYSFMCIFPHKFCSLLPLYLYGICSNRPLEQGCEGCKFPKAMTSSAYKIIYGCHLVISTRDFMTPLFTLRMARWTLS